MKLHVLVFVLVLLGMVVTGPALHGQVTWFVDVANCPGPGSGTRQDPFCEIRRAIDAAVDGDEILVRPGVYLENLDFSGKAIHLRSDADGDPATRDPDPGNTVLDGRSPVDPDLQCVVVFARGEGRDSVLEGFRLTAGAGWKGRFGGAVYCQDASPTIRGNRITGNYSVTAGGAIYVMGDSAPLIASNTIKDNVTGGGGGGIYLAGGPTAVIENNEIRGNAASHGGGLYVIMAAPIIRKNLISYNLADGGGINGIGGGIYAGGDPLIADNVVVYNEAVATGGGIACSNSTASLERNLVALNAAGSMGGGIYGEQSDISVSDCDVYGNVSYYRGGGILCFSVTMRISHTTIYGNIAAYVGGGVHGRVSLENSIIWGNQPEQIVRAATVTYCDVEGGYGGEGNVAVDPRFTDPDGPDNRLDTWEDNDLGLAGDSPCIDTGISRGACCTTDRDGNPRELDGRLDRARLPDMGAHEFDNIHLHVGGETRPGGSITIEITGTSGLPVILLVGGAEGAFCHDLFGCLFVDFSSFFQVFSWPPIPSTTTVVVPAGLPVPLPLIVQSLALAGAAGNGSNPISMTIE